jgi:hypothetical protein
MLGTYLHSFANDQLLQAVLVLIVVDLLLGVAAALRLGTFRLSYLSDFARTDLLGKVFPWFVLYSAGKAAPSTDVLGVNLSDLADAAGVVVAAALVGSLVSSVNDFFPGVTIPKIIGGGENPHSESG